ncbi:phage tail protein [Photobacterium angustum]|uniref:Phage tail protein n=1 Tax=Photobacterium angustum TaxID=661 RepID=A0A855SIU1_PHOAN|nr:phage tail protein [Photobacterium angustum]KJF83556.1 hypothetical protein UB36_03205 [Photobacterium damselae subsp. damselae]KJG42580.1 hypothetical protein UA35_00855 [Photobacterium angustum]KJG47864.1 hypothetical protein UA31_03205 [Photobacterium angustum]KJG49880.1 hypothetical protein UA30_04990 [Photobacterium angustum]KJG54028.1 hypothetical protein UA34_07165 [Photobacterium angustum]
MKLPKLTLPFWMGRGELAKLALALHGYWLRVQEVMQLPLAHLDPMTAPIEFVDLIAWQRDIQRLAKEPEDIYRIRVKYAFEFARNGGDVDGFRKVFEKLGLSWINLFERQDIENWDVITIETSDSDLSQKTWLMEQLIRQYGRTCRRYRFQVTFPIHGFLSGGAFGCSTEIYNATLNVKGTIQLNKTVNDHNQSVYSARL